jgi:Polycystin cation channel
LLSQSLLFIISIYVIVNAAVTLKRRGSLCLTDVWNDLDFLVGVLALTSFSLFVAFAVLDDVARSARDADPLQFVSSGIMGAVQESWRNVNATLLMLLWLVVSQFLCQSPQSQLNVRVNVDADDNADCSSLAFICVGFILLRARRTVEEKNLKNVNFQLGFSCPFIYSRLHVVVLARRTDAQLLKSIY